MKRPGKRDQKGKTRRPRDPRRHYEIRKNKGKIMSLLDTLTGDMKAALKARESHRLQTIRMLMAALKNERIKAGGELEEKDEIDLLAREAKRRRESIEAYEKAEREDLAVIERADLEVIEAYLPKPLTEDEVNALIAAAIADLGATSKKDMGAVMSAVMPALRGRFDGKDAKALVMAALP